MYGASWLSLALLKGGREGLGVQLVAPGADLCRGAAKIEAAGAGAGTAEMPPWLVTMRRRMADSSAPPAARLLLAKVMFLAHRNVTVGMREQLPLEVGASFIKH